MRKRLIKSTIFFTILILAFASSIFVGFLWQKSYKTAQNIPMPSQLVTLTAFPTPTVKLTRGKKLLPPESGIYHGAFADFGPSEDTVTEKRLTDFATLVGKDIVWAYFSNNWFGGIRFPKKEVLLLHNLGIVPYIRLMPRSRFQEGGQDPVYSLQNIADGEFDDQLRSWARAAKESNVPLIIEFGTEVNGDWFTWSGVANGAQTYGPQRFKDAFRHIVDLFQSEGAYDITWVFHVNLLSTPNTSWNTAAAYYPGDAYVDWIGVSVYGAQYQKDEAKVLSKLLAKHLSAIEAITPEKPIAIVEFGTIEQKNADKSFWIADALETIVENTYPRIKAVSYWHSRWVNADGTISNMRLDSSDDGLRVYKETMQNPLFVTKPIFSQNGQ